MHWKKKLMNSDSLVEDGPPAKSKPKKKSIILLSRFTRLLDKYQPACQETLATFRIFFTLTVRPTEDNIIS